MGLEQINLNPIGTRTIDTSDGHVTTCTRSERAHNWWPTQNWWSRVGLGKNYITSSNALALR